MPHQDTEDLRTPAAQFKLLMEPIQKLSFQAIYRHGNATLHLSGIAIVALLTFGWNQQRNLGERFEEARNAVRVSLDAVKLPGSFQALMVALRACGHELASTLIKYLLKHLSDSPSWLLLGRPTFAVDGSQFAVPGPKRNWTPSPPPREKPSPATKTQPIGPKHRPLRSQSHCVCT